ncbi:MAG: DNA polymerase III subunit epsilon [Neomegalonema sp.]|nr:DNA polymerase III subunit epsilon [Neomegalonema sp.]
MREIALDTETTGLDAENGDRIFEIGCVEMINRVASGEVYHVFIDPQRRLSQGSIDITGVKDEDLVGKPIFRAIVDSFIDFIGDDPLVIHNAAFDVRFINAEFARLSLKPLDPKRVVDTLGIARKRYPGAQNSLDALCRRFAIDNSAREKHGALLDAELLAEVYLELTGGRQPGLSLDAHAGQNSQQTRAAAELSARAAAGSRPQRRSLLSEAEKAAHTAFVATLGDQASWYATGLVDKSSGESE